MPRGHSDLPGNPSGSPGPYAPFFLWQPRRRPPHRIAGRSRPAAQSSPCRSPCDADPFPADLPQPFAESFPGETLGKGAAARGAYARDVFPQIAEQGLGHQAVVARTVSGSRTPPPRPHRESRPLRKPPWADHGPPPPPRPSQNPPRRLPPPGPETPVPGWKHKPATGCRRPPHPTTGHSSPAHGHEPRRQCRP